jgi:hypothetical protein
MYAHLNNGFISEFEPSEFYLSPNYPNPFKEKTVIKYCVAYRTRVLLTVYNEKSKEIIKLVDEVKNPGTYEVEFNSHSGEVRNLETGIYFYQLKADAYVDKKKMILIK